MKVTQGVEGEGKRKRHERGDGVLQVEKHVHHLHPFHPLHRLHRLQDRLPSRGRRREAKNEDEDEEIRNIETRVASGVRMSVDSGLGSGDGACAPSTSAPLKKNRWYHVHFRVACETKWGENLVLVGRGDNLGNFEPQSGLWMGCKQEHSHLQVRQGKKTGPGEVEGADSEGDGDGVDGVDGDDGDDGKVERAWRARMSVPAEAGKSGRSHYTVGPYRYIVVDQKVRRIRGEPHWVERTFDIPLDMEDGSVVCVHDTWQDPSGPPCVLRSAMFTKVVFRDALRSRRKSRELEAESNAKAAEDDRKDGGEGNTIKVSFRVKNWQVNLGQRVLLLGSLPKLGNWDVEKALDMRLEFNGDAGSDPYGTWCVDVSLPADLHDVAYKYILESGEQGSGRMPEKGNNRLLLGHERKQFELGKVFVVQEDGHFRHDNPWKGAGVAIPVFSLRSEGSVGCGEFKDLLLLIKFCRLTGMSVIQLLPVNDTSVHDNWMDSYPYSSLSVFALHPMYISLNQVIEDSGKEGLRDQDLQNIHEEVERHRKALDKDTVDYECTLKAKEEVCKKLFHLYKERCYCDPSFRKFLEDSAFWLAPYATFCAMKVVFGHSDHTNWGSLKDATYSTVKRMITGVDDRHCAGSANEDFGGLGKDLIELFNPNAQSKEPQSTFLAPLKELIAYPCFVQFHLHTQLSSAVSFAEANGVALKGDLPIGVDKNSVECWVRRECFRMDSCAGAPPDYYSTEGQNWGFPTYNWEAMRKENFSWWKQRLHHMAKYFHAYRIDHILGFFRIWEVPSSNDEGNSNVLLPGLLGCFRPAVPITRSELDSKGIWDIDRLCKPFITMDLLEEHFDDLAAVVADFFLFKRYDYYEFKEEYLKPNVLFWKEKGKWCGTFVSFLQGSQVSVDDLERTVAKVGEGLKAIIQNVVLLRDKGSKDSFHPRFGCKETHSFKALETWMQEAITFFHDDYFFNKQDDTWRRNASETLPELLLGSKDMLVCGEDLGLIPKCVPSTMNDLGILGLRIQRMPSDSSVEGEFGDLSNYPYHVVSDSFDGSFSLFISCYAMMTENNLDSDI